jgi:hypothetical protein
MFTFTRCSVCLYSCRNVESSQCVNSGLFYQVRTGDAVNARGRLICLLMSFSSSGGMGSSATDGSGVDSLKDEI